MKEKWYLYKKSWEELVAYFPWQDTDRIENNESNNYFIIACIISAAVTFLPSRSIPTTGGYTYKHTDRWEGFMKYDVEMGSGAMIYVPSFIKIGHSIQNLVEGTTESMVFA
jgi:hypothetical protein